MTRFIPIKNNEINFFKPTMISFVFFLKQHTRVFILRMTMVLLKHGLFNKFTCILMKHYYSKYF